MTPEKIAELRAHLAKLDCGSPRSAADRELYVALPELLDAAEEAETCQKRWMLRLGRPRPEAPMVSDERLREWATLKGFADQTFPVLARELLALRELEKVARSVASKDHRYGCMLMLGGLRCDCGQQDLYNKLAALDTVNSR